MKTPILLLTCLIGFFIPRNLTSQSDSTFHVSLSYMFALYKYPVTADYTYRFVQDEGSTITERNIYANLGSGIKLDLTFLASHKRNLYLNFFLFKGKSAKSKYAYTTHTSGFDTGIFRDETVNSQGVGLHLGHQFQHKLSDRWSYANSIKYGLFFPQVIYAYDQTGPYGRNSEEKFTFASKFFGTLSWELSSEITYAFNNIGLVLGVEYFDAIIPAKYLINRKVDNRPISNYLFVFEDRKIITYSNIGFYIGLALKLEKRE